MSGNIVSDFKTVATGPNSSIWNTEAMLPAHRGQAYHGRVFVEVWDTNVRLGITGDRSLGKRALAALQGPHIRASVRDIPWTDQPVTSESSGAVFLGRLVVELWNNQAVVAVTGSNPDQVLARATQRLVNLSAQSE